VQILRAQCNPSGRRDCERIADEQGQRGYASNQLNTAWSWRLLAMSGNIRGVSASCIYTPKSSDNVHVSRKTLVFSGPADAAPHWAMLIGEW
jgi:hypothetical protein